MERCESRTGGACARPATWEHSVHAGNREGGRFLYHSYWCDQHAVSVAEKRQRDRIAPPRMTRIGSGDVATAAESRRAEDDDGRQG
jgi:hypothetical protein